MTASLLRLSILTLALALSLPAAASGAQTGAASPAGQEEGGSLTAKYHAGKIYAQVALEVERLTRAYEADLDKAGLYKLLNAQRLQGDPDLAKGKAIVARSRELAASYKAKSLDLVKQGDARIQALDTDEETRARLAASWERHEAEARAEVEEAWRLENAVIDRMADVADLLARAKGKWRVSGESLSFDRSEDTADYNRRVASMRAAMQTQETFQSQAQKKAFKRLLELAK